MKRIIKLNEKQLNNIVKRVITEETNREKIVNKLVSYIKSGNWELAASIVGGVKNLVKIVFDGNYENYLNVFDNLKMTEAENLDSTYFIVNEDGKTLMQYQSRLGDLYVDDVTFYDFFVENDLDDYDITNLIRNWVKKKFGINHAAIDFTDYFSEDYDIEN
jgi:hypothetical protein